MLHHHDDLLDARDEIHRAAHALDHLAGDHPVGDVAVLRDLHRAEHGEVDMPAADHREAVRRGEIGRLRQLADRLLAGVDQIGVHLVLIGERADAQHPVLGLQRHRHPFGNVVRHQRRDADAEVDVEAVLELLGGARAKPIAVKRRKRRCGWRERSSGRPGSRCRRSLPPGLRSRPAARARQARCPTAPERRARD